MVTKGLNKITQNETQDTQLVDNFCKSWGGTVFDGLIDKAEAIKRLRFEKPNLQFCFRSQLALCCLAFIKATRL